MPERKSIYLDYNATTPVDPRVLEEMMPYFKEHFGNSVSSQHSWGWTAQRAVEKARKQVADLIGAEPNEITFTSGSTEGNNWTLQSLFYQWQTKNPEQKIHILSSPVEHSSVLKTLEYLQSRGADVEFVPVNKYGQVEVDEILRRVRPETRLMSFMWVNNEIGSINPVKEIGELAHESKIYFHSDATQAVGKIPVNLKDVKVDFLTLSGHKIYGPKGVGALFIRSKNPRIELQPLIWGGGHEKGLRSGTVNTPAVVGLGKACEICNQELLEEMKQHTEMRFRFLKDLKALVPEIQLNGHPEDRSPNNLNITFKSRTLDEALPFLMRIGFSTGSACHSSHGGGSGVLKALGLSEKDMNSTLRLSFGRFTTHDELQEAIQLLSKAFGSQLEPSAL